MTTILKSDYYTQGKVTLVVEQYQDWGSVPFWRVVYAYGLSDLFRVYKRCLLHRPSKKRIQAILDELAY